MGNTSYIGLAEAEQELTRVLNRHMEKALKDLLETKHLYQKTAVQPDDIVAGIKKRVLTNVEEKFALAASAFLSTVVFVPCEVELRFAERGSATTTSPTLILDNVKVFCHACGTREVLSPVWYADVSNELRKPHSRGPLVQAPPWHFQLFFLAYQCQRCKSEPQGFLVSRHRWQLTLEGRSPIEQIEVPEHIPRREQKYYRDAIIAYNAGKTLAALFYLRTFIEQFARRITGINARRTGEEIMDAYKATLPEAQRDQMPSLRQWYERLSEALHGADEDSDLFEKARENVDQHFAIRHVFKMN